MNVKNNDLESQKRFFIENIARYCDKCSKAYELDDVEILQHNDYSTIIHFSCKNCKAQHMATFIRPLGLSSRIPVNTDLSVEELQRFAGKRAISSDDVLDAHEFFKQDKITIGDIISRSR